MSENTIKHDIFISYRRQGGFETARYLYDHLKWDGYAVTFDLDSLRSGRFDEALLARIDECTDFLVVLSKGCFERTLDPGFPRENDWLRWELGYAIEKKKNVIPVVLGGFEMPGKLPPDIDAVRLMNGLAYSQEYIDSFYGKLKRFLKTEAPSGQGSGAQMPGPPIRARAKVPPASFLQALARYLDTCLPWQDFRLVTGIEFRDGTGNVHLIGHAVGSPWGVFLIGCQTGADMEPDGKKDILIPEESLIKEFAAVIAAQCEILSERVHYLFAIPEESRKSRHPAWVVASETGVLAHLKKYEKEVRVLDWGNIHREITQRLESFPMTRMGREANILKHFHAGTPEELEDGATLLAWADNPSDELLDAAEQAHIRLRNMGKKRLSEGVKAWFRVMADRGNVLAMDHYGWMLGDEKAAERVEWFRRAADFGGAHAQNSLGWCLHEGWGVERNRDEALRLFRTSAAQGNRFGQASLALAYAEPDFAGLPPDSSEAFRLWRLSADQGLPDSQLRLGECYEKGFGTTSDMAKARHWYEKAAKSGNEKVKQEAESGLVRLDS